jgi:hypothetical protein
METSLRGVTVYVQSDDKTLPVRCPDRAAKVNRTILIGCASVLDQR